jgi:hypothetical protein
MLPGQSSPKGPLRRWEEDIFQEQKFKNEDSVIATMVKGSAAVHAPL